MSNFKQNTVETVGDEALADSIVDRSITELQDNITMSIAAQKFRGCDALASVIFPSVSSVGIGAFCQCTALKQADFAACVSFAQNSFYGCSALEALILRNTEAVSSLTGNLSGTKIASGTGYIYVPSALVDTYKATSGWSTYAAQIRAIEDWPEICDPQSWEAVFKTINNGTYASVYSIGDTVPLDLGSNGVVNMQIAAFDTDTLADGSGNAPITWIMEDGIYGTYDTYVALVTESDGTYREGTGAIGGWEKHNIRTYLQDVILPIIPDLVRNNIKTVTKLSGSYDVNGNYESGRPTDDIIWLPSTREVFNETYSWVTQEDGHCYSVLFPNSDSRIKRITRSDSVYDWPLRSADSIKFLQAASNNGMGTSATYDLHSLVFGFCT